jgi:hypothetical protein
MTGWQLATADGGICVRVSWLLRLSEARTWQADERREAAAGNAAIRDLLCGQDPDRWVLEAHVPHRCRWNCLACDQSWPCGPAQHAVLAELGPDERVAYLLAHMRAAAPALAPAAAGELRERFLDWIPAAFSLTEGSNG